MSPLRPARVREMRPRTLHAKQLCSYWLIDITSICLGRPEWQNGEREGVVSGSVRLLSRLQACRIHPECQNWRDCSDCKLLMSHHPASPSALHRPTTPRPARLSTRRQGSLLRRRLERANGGFPVIGGRRQRRRRGGRAQRRFPHVRTAPAAAPVLLI